MFFQVLLLGGYIYAHQIASAFRPSLQGKAHLAFLAIHFLLARRRLVFLELTSPSRPFLETGARGGTDPRNPGIIIYQCGPALSSSFRTGPLLQSWYAHLDLSEHNKPPYFLYALSNAGSVLGLLSYPFFLEPTFRSENSKLDLGGGFAVFALSCAVCAWQIHRSLLKKAHPIEEDYPIGGALKRLPDAGYGFFCPCLLQSCFWRLPIF